MASDDRVMSALEHDERCEIQLSTEKTVYRFCRCAERALAASRWREEEAKEDARQGWAAAHDADGTAAEAILERDALRAENARLTLAASEAQAQAESWRLSLGHANDKLLELQTAASESARTLQVEITRLKQRGGICPHSALGDCAADNTIEERDALQAQVAALREALRKYGLHLLWCPARRTTDPCECGLDAILAALPQDGA